MIMVTGAVGFIGRNLIKAMDGNVCTFDSRCLRQEDPMEAVKALGPYRLGPSIEAIIHLGAISDTTCMDEQALHTNNMALPQQLSSFCAEKNIPFIYASSAAVYGNGNGPLNPYARFKLLFDDMMAASSRRVQWYGLRLFNVYGPGEAHKGRQASMVHQVIKAFRDGEKPRIWLPDAKRDFIYVGDVVKTILWFLKHRPASGIYDVGTGEARSFEEMVDVVEEAMGVSMGYVEVPIPPELETRYQTHTRASYDWHYKVHPVPPMPMGLEEGVREMLRAR